MNKTPSQKLSAQNALANKYASEARQLIGSPFRVSLYVKARMNGLTQEQALKAAKGK